MADIEEILAAKKPRHETAWILVDPDLQAKHQDLVDRLDEAKDAEKGREKGWRTEVPRLEAELDQLEAEIAAQRHPFQFKSLGRTKYGALLDEFPPREGNRTDRLTGFDSDEFPPALLAASAVDPEMTVAHAKEIWGGEDWSDAETTRLFQAALKAQKELVDVPFTRNGSAMETSSTGKSSSTPQTTDSPTQSS